MEKNKVSKEEEFKELLSLYKPVTQEQWENYFNIVQDFFKSKKELNDNSSSNNS